MSLIMFMIMMLTPSFAQSPIDSILTDDAIHALRDPFQVPNVVIQLKENPKSDLENFALRDFKLSGVITGSHKAKAMVTLPNSKTFFISIGDRIGVREGHVVAIAGDSIKVVEYDRDEAGKRIPEMFELSISGTIVSLTNKEGR